MRFNRNIHAILDWLENNIDNDHMKRVKNRHITALKFEALDKPVAQIGFPIEGLDPYAYIETYGDMEKMLYNELVAFVPSVALKDDGILSIRSNFGVGTMPSLFGTTDQIMDDDTKPWVNHMSEDEIKRILDMGLPDFENGYGKKMRNIYSYYREVLSKYPKCEKHIHLCQPDMQGPFDIAHLLMGSNIYYAIYDDPETVHKLLSLITDTYVLFLNGFNPLLTDKFCSEEKNYCFQGQYIWGGNVVIRNDTAVNLSKEHYLEFAKPYDERILADVGGGSVHFCGRADQWIEAMFATKNIGGINFGYMDSKYTFGQPLMDFIKPCVDKNRVPVIAYYLSDAESDSFDFCKYNTGITFCFSATNIDEAKRIQDDLST